MKDEYLQDLLQAEHPSCASKERKMDGGNKSMIFCRQKKVTEKIYSNLTSKACQTSLWPQTSKEIERHPGQMPRLLLERGIRMYLRVKGRCEKVEAKNGIIGICRAGLKTL